MPDIQQRASVADACNAGQTMPVLAEQLTDPRPVLESMVECLPAYVWTADVDKRCSHFNRAWCEFRGRTLVEELSGSWTEGIHPEDLDRAVERYVHAFDRREVFESEYRVKNAAGEYQWLLDKGAPVYGPSGDFVGYAGTCVNIHSRKRAQQALRESEERLRATLESLSDLIVVFDTEGVIFSVHSPVEISRQLAIDVASPPRTLLEVFGSRATEKLRAAALSSRDRGAFEDLEFDVDGIDGRRRVVARVSSHVSGDATTAAVRDVTRQRAAELARRTAEASLNRAQRLDTIGTLASGIAHDFNNLLTPILMATEFALLHLDDDSPARNDLALAARAAVQARELVHRLLALSRESEPALRPTRLSPVVAEALQIVRASLPTTTTLDSDLNADPAPVLADATQIQQLVINLCINAHDSFGGQAGTIRVGTSTRALAGDNPVGLPAGTYAVLTVADNGCGIAEAELERIFDPFFTTKPAGKGTGLGLAVCHGIATGHGGALRVDSSPGVGTAFEVYLPVGGPGRPNDRNGSHP